MTQHLTEERQRMIQLERVASWREIARRLAQELGEAMSRLQRTIEELQPGGGLHDSAETLLSETQAMKEIVGRYGDFSRMPRPVFAAVNLNDIVKSVVKLFAPRFSAVGRPPVNPEVHLDEDLPVIQADASLLHRALENLVLNAMDAMPAGGVLMIRTSQQDGDVELEVSDTGSGLSAEESERLFAPYYATKQHGTGLGLAIVQSVVSDHGGRITVESETGVGTSFHITLPAKPPARITGKGSSALRPAEHPLQNEMRGQIDHDDHE
jgi:signal transduction histidine kinase